MATVYINPEAATNGSGASLVDPMNTWPTTGWVAGNEYLQRGGTTFAGSIAPNLSGTSGARILISSCDSSGAKIVDGSSMAVVAAGADQDAVDLGRAGSRSYFDVVGLDLRGGTGTSRSAIYGLGATETTVRLNTVRRCVITAQAGSGINARGDGWHIADCIISDCQIDGILLLGMNLQVERNTITGNDTGLVNGDAIQISTAASVGYSVIRRNTIHHPQLSPKQGIICSGASGTMLIEDNVIINGGQSAIAMQVPSGVVKRNTIIGCINGVSVLSAGVSVISNLVCDGESGVIFTVNAATGALIYGNTFVDLSANGVYNVTAAALATWTAKNNAFVRALNGIRAVNGAVTVQSSNSFWECGTNLSGAVSGGGDITADPMLSTGYRPRAGSPLIGAGAHLGYTRDLYGKQRPNPPSIGAHDVSTLRRRLTADPAA